MAEELVYEDPPQMTCEEAERALASDDADATCLALLAIALHDPDWRRVQDWCVRLSSHPAAHVRRIVATALGHVARLHGHLDENMVFPVLERLMQDPKTSGTGDDALDDIVRYLEQGAQSYEELQRRYKPTLIPWEEALKDG